MAMAGELEPPDELRRGPLRLTLGGPRPARSRAAPVHRPAVVLRTFTAR